MIVQAESASVRKLPAKRGGTAEGLSFRPRVDERFFYLEGEMSLEKQYKPQEMEIALEKLWQEEGIYHYDSQISRPVFSIDTPPPTVSGKLHIGHLYSYSHPDFIARYQRMRGRNVYYPMGFDDNGLPTERLVERTTGIRAQDVGREAFRQKCLEVSIDAEKEYASLFRRLGLSVDWRISYRTIDSHSQRCAQQSFNDLYDKGLVYRALSPAIWCTECGASFAQADLEDRIRWSEYVTLPFVFSDGGVLPVATTRSELLAACVAVFIHPGDERYRVRLGEHVSVPLYGQRVPVLSDPAADPAKGTGAVMCCTFGDQADVNWQRTHNLPVIEAIDASGTMTLAADFSNAANDEKLSGLPVDTARKKIKEYLAARGLILSREPLEQSIRVHERCGLPVEYRVVNQWFIRVLEHKEKFLKLGEQLRWHPAHMHARYRAWVENLNWDWSISRQRFFGVPFPVWFCKACGETILADPKDLPVDPCTDKPRYPCRCGSTDFIPDMDLMDTWATSSSTPQIVTGWLDEPARFEALFPLTLRPQAHDIIRTWLFYSIVKSWYQFGCLPWNDALISGWGVAGVGQEKISKSKGGGPVAPLAMIEKYSADAVRYWAASAGTGKDAIIIDEKFQNGAKLVTKLWNVARFAEPFLAGVPAEIPVAEMTAADRWILARCAQVVERVTGAFDEYEYAAARAEIEDFFWRDLADNYLEMAKLRLYDPHHPAHRGACFALKKVLRVVLALLAPLLPYITDAVWLALFKEEEGGLSIHRSSWPEPSQVSSDWRSSHRAQKGSTGLIAAYISLGNALIAVASAVRRYKSENGLSLGSQLPGLAVAAEDPALLRLLVDAQPDLLSITRAKEIALGEEIMPGLAEVPVDADKMLVAIVKG